MPTSVTTHGDGRRHIHFTANTWDLPFIEFDLVCGAIHLLDPSAFANGTTAGTMAVYQKDDNGYHHDDKKN